MSKHCWKRSQEPLITLIQKGLAKKQYPLFVAEGTPEKKLEQIHSNAYLFYALGKLSRIENRLVTFGHSLGASDLHIRKVIANNKKLKELFVGTRDADNSSMREAIANIQAIRAAQGIDALEVVMYDSTSAGVWGI